MVCFGGAVKCIFDSSNKSDSRYCWIFKECANGQKTSNFQRTRRILWCVLAVPESAFLIHPINPIPDTGEFSKIVQTHATKTDPRYYGIFKYHEMNIFGNTSNIRTRVMRPVRTWIFVWATGLIRIRSPLKTAKNQRTRRILWCALAVSSSNIISWWEYSKNV